MISLTLLNYFPVWVLFTVDIYTEDIFRNSTCEDKSLFILLKNKTETHKMYTPHYFLPLKSFSNQPNMQCEMFVLSIPRFKGKMLFETRNISVGFFVVVHA